MTGLFAGFETKNSNISDFHIQQKSFCWKTIQFKLSSTHIICFQNIPKKSAPTPYPFEKNFKVQKMQSTGVTQNICRLDFNF